MNGKGWGRSVLALALAGMLALTGCAGGEEDVIYQTETLPQNDGNPAELSLYAGDHISDGYREALEEIIAKYQADYPNTEVRLADSQEAADIVPVTWQSGQEELLDFSEYMDAWNNEGTLTAGAALAMRYQGGRGAYAVPLAVEQPMLFYRSDWVEEYNADKNWQEKVYLESWEQLLTACGQLGERGRLVIAQPAGAVFEAVLWSTLGIDNLADKALGFYGAAQEPYTIFISKKTPIAMELFTRLYDMAEDLSSLEGDTPEVQAFLDGEAGLLIASASTAQRLTEEMPEGAWAAVGLPVGESGTAVVPCQWEGLGIRAGTNEPEKAVHFLSYLTNVDNNTHLAKVCGFLPIYRESTAMEPALLEGVQAAEMRLLGEADYLYAGTYDLVRGGVTQEAVENAVLRLLDGELSQDEFCRELDGYYMELIQDYLGTGNILPWANETEEEEEEGEDA